MNEASKTSPRATLTDTPSATSLPGSASGPTPCARRAGPTTAPSGPEVARANLSARQAKQAGLLTSGTFGPPSSTSSSSAALASSLASRLRARTALLGSTLYTLTWKERVTPQQHSIFALRASAPRTSGNGSIGWPTPTKTDSARHCSPNFTTKNITLNHAAVSVAGWVTPSARDWKDTPGMSTTGVDPDGSTRKRIDQLPRQAAQVDFGAMSSGFHSEMVSSALLNPALSRWLQGLPQQWDDCAPTATPSARKSQSSSSTLS